MTADTQNTICCNNVEKAVQELQSYKGKTIAVGLSGGVDSSTVLALLARAGARVFGISMKIYNPEAGTVPEGIDACYGPGETEDFALCASMCKSLGVPYHVIDCAKAYEERILSYFRREYLAGRTPNPCVRCNLEMKFGFMLEEARRHNLDFDYFATGHYVRIAVRNGVLHLQKATDNAKDQSYFLYRLPPETLAKLIFPLGKHTKREVKELARSLRLPTADKAESQDFVGGAYSLLFDNTTPGDMVDETGKVLGRHRGIIHYTIGQRRGLGVSSTGEPYYVLAINADKNQVVLSTNKRLFSNSLEGSDVVLHDRALGAQPFRAFVKIRQAHAPARATVCVQTDGSAATAYTNAKVDSADNESSASGAGGARDADGLGPAAVRIIFDEPQRAIAPGQSAVFYDDDGFVLGGCIIERGIGLMTTPTVMSKDNLPTT